MHGLRSFGPPFRALVDYHLERGWMLLHDAVGVSCKRSATTENQDPGAWYLGCVSDFVSEHNLT